MSELTLEDLNHVGSAELQYEAWSFYMVDAWKGPDGFYIGTDSGCSCPMPFEWLRSPDQLTGPLTAEQAIEEITSLGTAAYDAESTKLAEASVARLIEAIRVVDGG